MNKMSLKIVSGTEEVSMKGNRRIAFLAGIGLILATASIVAHHSVSAEFDTNKKITFTGAVKRVDWGSPHIYIQVEAKTPEGKTVVYKVEGGAPNPLYRAGVRPDKLKIGTVVTCTNCSRSKNPDSMNVNGRLTTADGKPFLAAVPDEYN